MTGAFGRLKEECYVSGEGGPLDKLGPAFNNLVGAREDAGLGPGDSIADRAHMLRQCDGALPKQHTRLVMACEFDISVVICTRNRADSLHALLTLLSQDDLAGLRVEILVVDNNSEDNTRDVVESFRDTFSVRYVAERREGKCHALNRALDEGVRGAIVAFVDDDIVPESGWFQGVKKVCDRWPAHDIFGARSYVIFPENTLIPDWARNKRIHRMAFSVRDHGNADIEFGHGFFPMGGHFWVRSRALTPGRRFPVLWLTEPGLILGLQEDGYSGVNAGDIRVGHRVQPHLLQSATILRRSVQFGKDTPYVRLPYPRIFKQARWFRDHPYIWVSICVLNAARWALQYGRATLIRDPGESLLAKAASLRALCNNLETVCHFRRIQRFCKSMERDEI